MFRNGIFWKKVGLWLLPPWELVLQPRPLPCAHVRGARRGGAGPSGTQGTWKALPLIPVDRQLKSLSSVLSRYQGFDGEDGGSKNCFGRGGAILYVQVGSSPAPAPGLPGLGSPGPGGALALHLRAWGPPASHRAPAFTERGPCGARSCPRSPPPGPSEGGSLSSF